MAYHRMTREQLVDGDGEFLAAAGTYLRHVVRLLSQIERPRWQEQAAQERQWEQDNEREEMGLL